MEHGCSLVTIKMAATAWTVFAWQFARLEADKLFLCIWMKMTKVHNIGRNTHDGLSVTKYGFLVINVYRTVYGLIIFAPDLFGELSWNALWQKIHLRQLPVKSPAAVTRPRYCQIQDHLNFSNFESQLLLVTNPVRHK